jgi:predicted metal-dependent hydrolase
VSSRPGTSTHILPGDPPIEVVLRRSSRATRFSLRVSRSDGRVSMSLPLWAPEDEALAFLRDRADWVRGHLDQAPEPRIARIGEAIPVCGVPRPIIRRTGARRAFRRRPHPRAGGPPDRAQGEGAPDGHGARAPDVVRGTPCRSIGRTTRG